MEDVDNYFEIIEHDPLARRKSVDRHRSNLVIFLQACLDLARDRFQLRFRRRRADHEEIGEGGDAAQVQDDDVFRFFIGSELGAARS